MGGYLLTHRMTSLWRHVGFSQGFSQRHKTTFDSKLPFYLLLPSLIVAARRRFNAQRKPQLNWTVQLSSVSRFALGLWTKSGLFSSHQMCTSLLADWQLSLTFDLLLWNVNCLRCSRFEVRMSFYAEVMAYFLSENHAALRPRPWPWC